MMRLILPLLIIVIALGLFFKFTDAQFGQIDALRQEQVTLNTALDNARKLHKVEEILREKFNAIPPEDLTSLEKMLPDNVDNVRLIIDIDNMASKYGMKLRNLKVETEEEKAEDAVIRDKKHSKQASVILGFTVSGGYGNFKSFANDLSRSLRLVDVVSTSFGSNEKGLYDYNVEIQTYWLK